MKGRKRQGARVTASHPDAPKPEENRAELSSGTRRDGGAQWGFGIWLFLLYLAAAVPIAMLRSRDFAMRGGLRQKRVLIANAAHPSHAGPLRLEKDFALRRSVHTL